MSHLQWSGLSAVVFLACLHSGVVSGELDRPWALDQAGRFGASIRPGAHAVLSADAPGMKQMQGPPLTVELWAKLDSKSDFNILLANQTKESVSHWELYTYSGTGCLSLYLPGASPATIQSDRDICDGAWHYLVMTLASETAHLYADGEEVAVQPVAYPAVSLEDTILEPLTVGRVLSSRDPMYGCDGLIDEVRISQSARTIIGVPEAPFEADSDTLALWHFEDLEGDRMTPDASESGNGLTIEQLRPISLDEKDLASYAPGPEPLATPPVEIELHPGTLPLLDAPRSQALDGEWELIEGGDVNTRVFSEWPESMPAQIPGSIHTALYANGRIEEPHFGLNHHQARENSFKTWWLRRRFQSPMDMRDPVLMFEGVAVSTEVWLNQKRLGTHEGMFGGPTFAVADQLQEDNVLVVRIDPAPSITGIGQLTGFFKGMNIGWCFTTVFNNVYGWHYSNIPSIGIWAPVHIEESPTVSLGHPFIVTRDAHQGAISLVLDLEGPRTGWAGEVEGVISPRNFEGQTFHFKQEVASEGQTRRIHLRFNLPDPQVWWPNGLGGQPLYTLDLAMIPEGKGLPDRQQVSFGVRTVEMGPLPGGPRPDLYNWTYIINGQPIFVKGANWCTMDSCMDFSHDRYDRVLSLAHDQHIQMLRAWGSGMPETDTFYDLCDQYGLMVIQEWPTAWDSHLHQPYDLLEETVRLNTLRIRNHPSLVMWGGGNESGKPFGRAIDMMGRYSVELDGSRAFHRGEPYGGSQHNYNCWWGKQPLDSNVTLTVPFMGEFGIASLPVLESVKRYLPDDEKNLWPPKEDGAFAYHTPVFNTMEDMERLRQYSGYFMPPDTMEHFVLGSQLAQVSGVRHTLERARTQWPTSTGALYYKLNDNYPAASWSSIDWYGAPKLSHYFFQDSFAPLQSVVLPDTLDMSGKDVALPVFVLDDARTLKDRTWSVQVRAYSASLTPIEVKTWSGKNPTDTAFPVAEFTLASKQCSSNPLFLVSDLSSDGSRKARNYYWFNYERKPGCLLELPQTTLEMHIDNGQATVTNTGTLPAVAVEIAQPGHADTFTVSDNLMWIDPGETVTVTVNATEGLVVRAWNAPETGLIIE